MPPKRLAPPETQGWTRKKQPNSGHIFAGKEKTCNLLIKKSTFQTVNGNITKDDIKTKNHTDDVLIFYETNDKHGEYF